ncbi:hypothetical protein Q9295_10085 [Xinfangfangia sp. CPCC 101601]|uniref:Transcriptional regulator n=1 Tax=Pseudogemmobacter lacusdianii TaxID=3069608 RepID=A0ABU0VY96_9RHOB|nr:hypothetical protein [Xinfangfangia sp. CPCC 101601]MDQ2066726.1 hypothetical protein [Xinfangfangia sp. CPCC 101601]
MTPEDIAALRNTANKLRQLWGNNPDSALIDKAADLLDQPPATEVPAADKPSKTAKKG